jgi:hypothetical protein
MRCGSLQEQIFDSQEQVQVHVCRIDKIHANQTVLISDKYVRAFSEDIGRVPYID